MKLKIFDIIPFPILAFRATLTKPILYGEGPTHSNTKLLGENNRMQTHFDILFLLVYQYYLVLFVQPHRSYYFQKRCRSLYHQQKFIYLQVISASN